MKNRGYSIYGFALLGLMSFAQWSGFSLHAPAYGGRHMLFAPGIPRTIRENPGALRPNYHPSMPGFGGK
jgi:hypothetical protein